MHTRHHFTSCT